MLSLDSFSGFVFDFDGLLVDSEWCHYRAYEELLARRGYKIPWTLPQYLVVAHRSTLSLRDAVYAHFPEFQAAEPDWEQLRLEKGELYLELMRDEGAPLMPGAGELIAAIVDRGLPLCVATHSKRPEVEQLRNRHPILEKIPRWITREEYSVAKPDPACYHMAIDYLGVAPEKIIGFEDSPRGMIALQAAGIGRAIWVAPESYGGPRDFLGPRALQFESLSRVFDLCQKEAVSGHSLRS